jgi:DNA-directed RNA polymerase subunit omega
LIFPEGDAVKEHVQNRYSLVVLAAKRAKQIKEGAPPLIDTHSTNPLTIALEEIAAGKINYMVRPESVEGDDEAGAADLPISLDHSTDELEDQPSIVASTDLEPETSSAEPEKTNTD